MQFECTYLNYIYSPHLHTQQESATQFIANINAQLDEGVKPPPEMDSLQQARDADADEKILAIKIYELMIGE